MSSFSTSDRKSLVYIPFISKIHVQNSYYLPCQRSKYLCRSLKYRESQTSPFDALQICHSLPCDILVSGAVLSIFYAKVFSWSIYIYIHTDCNCSQWMINTCCDRDLWWLNFLNNPRKDLSSDCSFEATAAWTGHGTARVVTASCDCPIQVYVAHIYRWIPLTHMCIQMVNLEFRLVWY